MVSWLGEAYEKMNEAVGIQNFYMINGGGKLLVRPFKSQEFWKFIGYILLEITYGKKWHKLLIDIPKSSCRIASPKIRRDVCGNTDLYKVCCAHYCRFYIYACHWIILSYTNFFISWMFLWVLTFLYLLQVWGISLTRFNEFRTFWPC